MRIRAERVDAQGNAIVEDPVAGAKHTPSTSKRAPRYSRARSQTHAARNVLALDPPAQIHRQLGREGPLILREYSDLVVRHVVGTAPGERNAPQQ